MLNEIKVNLPSQEMIDEYNSKISKLLNETENAIEEAQEKFIKGMELKYNPYNAYLELSTVVRCPSAETLIQFALEGKI